MGIAPIWGFQMMTALALSIVFRLNKVLVLVASNISIPPMWPVIIYLSHLTGGYWLGDEAQGIAFNSEITLETAKQNFFQYVIGAFTLATLAGVIFAAATYLILKIFKRRHRIQ